MTISSPGRYVITLERTPLTHSHQQILHQIFEEFGLEEAEAPVSQQIPEGSQGKDLEYVFGQSKITLEGEVAAFK